MLDNWIWATFTFFRVMQFLLHCARLFICVSDVSVNTSGFVELYLVECMFRVCIAVQVWLVFFR